MQRIAWFVRTIIIVAFLTLGIVGFVLSAFDALFPPQNNVPSEPELVGTFCPKVEIAVVDFGILNDVQSILRDNSIFRDTARDQTFLFKSALKTIFAFLAVAEREIPAWAQDMVSSELERSPDKPDYSILNDVYERLTQEAQYADLNTPERKKELLESSVSGMIKALGDPFAGYVPPDPWKAGQANNTGRYRGIGVGITVNARGEIAISSVSPGGPAQKADIRPNDAILGINGLSTNDCSVSEFILNVRALSNPELRIAIGREQAGSLKRDTFDLLVTMEEIKQRALITYPGVQLPAGRGLTSQDLAYRCPGTASGEPCPFADNDGNGYPDVLYIKIKEFSDQAAKDLANVLARMDFSKFKGIVVDVRGNPGGLVDATVDSIDYFLPTNDTIITEKNARNQTVTYRSNRITYVPAQLPLAILVGSDSFSGAEVFSAALRDNGFAVLVSRDTRTGGKGSINRHFPLRGGEYGALYVSFALWLTPKGDMIEAQDLDKDGYYEVGGLRPDIYVPWSDDDYQRNSQDVNHDPTVLAALRYIQEQQKKK